MNQTKLTQNILKSYSPCASGYEWYQKNCLEKGIEDTSLIIEMLIKDNRLPWANWTIARALSKENKIRYAIFAAEQVIEIFEQKYPNDDRPRKAIEAAKVYLKEPSRSNKKDAAYAAANASDAAYAAHAAANAAHAAANAACAAANTAACAADNTAAYAVHAVHAAHAANAAKIKILEYGIELMKDNP